MLLLQRNVHDHPILAYMTSEGVGDLLDTTLIAKDGKVLCHAVVILSRLSSYLDQQPGGDYTIMLPDFSTKDLEQMLSYCYTGRCTGRLPGDLSSLLHVMNFRKKQADITAAAIVQTRRSGTNQSDQILEEVENNEFNVSVVSSSNSSCVQNTSKSPDIVGSDEYPKVCAVMNPINNNDANPTTNHNIMPKKVRVLNPQSSDNLKCNYCDMNFMYTQNLWRHIREYHLNNIDEFVCESCRFVFKRKDHLERHRISKVCLKEVTLNSECKNCKKMFMNVDQLKRHVQKNCTKKFFCNTCLKFFMKKKDFLYHKH